MGYNAVCTTFACSQYAGCLPHDLAGMVLPTVAYCQYTPLARYMGTTYHSQLPVGPTLVQGRQTTIVRYLVLTWWMNRYFC